MNFLELIEKAKAQGADSLASPTFPFTPPGGVIPDPGDQPSAEATSVTMETNSNSVVAGETFRIRLIVDSQEDEIDNLTITISFDPDYFQVIDSDQTQNGTQVDFLDTALNETANSVNNTTGIISLKAETEEVAASVTRTIAEIELTAIKSGTSEIKVLKSNSTLISPSGTDLLEDVNAINFNISTQSNQIDPSDQDPIDDGYIPKTGFYDDPAFLTIGLGMLLIVVGIILTRISRGEKNHKD